MRDQEHGPDYQDLGLLFCWGGRAAPHPDTITRRFKRLLADLEPSHLAWLDATLDHAELARLDRDAAAAAVTHRPI